MKVSRAGLASWRNSLQITSYVNTSPQHLDIRQRNNFSVYLFSYACKYSSLWGGGFRNIEISVPMQNSY